MGSRIRILEQGTSTRPPVQLPFRHRRERVRRTRSAAFHGPPIRHRRHHVAHPQGLRQNLRAHRGRNRPGGQRRRPGHRAERPRVHGDRHRARGPRRRPGTRPPRRRLRPAAVRPRGHPRPARRLLVRDRHLQRQDPPGVRGVHPVQPRRHLHLRGPPRHHPAGQQPRTGGPARQVDLPGAAHRGAGVRPGRGRWLHGGRGPPGPCRRVGRHRRHLHQLRGRQHPVGYLADLRGDRGQGRPERHDQGPRLRVRGGPGRPPGQPRPQARQGAGPVRPRGGRGRPQARPPLPHRGRLQPQRTALPLDPAGRLPARPRPAAHPRRRRGRPPGVQVLRLRRPVRGRPLPRHEDRHGVRRRLGRRARPRRPQGVHAQAVRRRPGHPRPQAGGHVVGGRRRLRRLLLRPRGEPGSARRPGLVLRPPAPDPHPQGADRREPGPGPRRRVRRPGQHHRLAVRRSCDRRGRRGRPAPVRRHRQRPHVPDRPQRAEHRHRTGAGVQRVHRCHLLARRADPLRQHPDPGHHGRHHRALEAPAQVTGHGPSGAAHRHTVRGRTRGARGAAPAGSPRPPVTLVKGPSPRVPPCSGPSVPSRSRPSPSCPIRRRTGGSAWPS
ncbi:hypothetical protein SGPA1_31481 [Streptomyces misionensis JCM 4497]